MTPATSFINNNVKSPIFHLQRRLKSLWLVQVPRQMRFRLIDFPHCSLARAPLRLINDDIILQVLGQFFQWSTLYEESSEHGGFRLHHW